MSGSQCIYCGAMNERGPYKGTCPQCPPGQELVQKFGIPAGPPKPDRGFGGEHVPRRPYERASRRTIEDLVNEREDEKAARKGAEEMRKKRLLYERANRVRPKVFDWMRLRTERQLSSGNGQWLYTCELPGESVEVVWFPGGAEFAVCRGKLPRTPVPIKRTHERIEEDVADWICKNPTEEMISFLEKWEPES